MSHIAIRVEHLAKKYRIGGPRQKYQLLRDQLSRLAAVPFRRKPQAAPAPSKETFWALDDVSFQIAAGEVVGIIGRNGAGKSTLLKILSRITEPTTGAIDILGRVGSLLEVGTGFHHELTGRENVYLNGAILGMRRREIDRKFDEIVAFAEVEKFIDMPVKHYSSGMYLRLAFAVAAHLEPEILLVDEVLAVGDIAFQKKCLGKMNSVAARGRTVLFVSHNLAAIKDLCTSCLVLDRGRAVFHGPVLDGLATYSAPPEMDKAGSYASEAGWGRIAVTAPSDPKQEWVSSADRFEVRVTLTLQEHLTHARLYCLMESSAGEPIVHNFVHASDIIPDSIDAGCYSVNVSFPPLWLVPDAYTLYFKLWGRRSDGQDVRMKSDLHLLDMRNVTDQTDRKVRAKIIPPLAWSAVRDTACAASVASEDQ